VLKERPEAGWHCPAPFARIGRLTIEPEQHLWKRSTLPLPPTRRTRRAA
jgi:hypothetical protein